MTNTLDTDISPIDEIAQTRILQQAKSALPRRRRNHWMAAAMAAVLLLGTGAIPVSATEGTVSGNSIQTENQMETETNTGGETSVCEECKQENGAHGETCSKYVAECTCSAEGDVHAEDCPLYEEPAEEQSTGTQPEAGCTCTDKCTETVVNADCALCSLEGAALSACAGETASDTEENNTVSGNDTQADTPDPETEPMCTCTEVCTEGAVNADCALCSLEGADLSACAGENVSAVKTITGWSWIEAEGFEDMIDSENILPLVGVNERNPVAL